MTVPEINYWAVLVAAIIRIAVGFDGANFAGEFLSAARSWARVFQAARASALR